MASKTSIKKRWNETPLIARAGIVVLGVGVLYKWWKKSNEPKQIRCPHSFSSGQIEVLQNLARKLYAAMEGTANPTMGVTKRSTVWKAFADIANDYQYAACYIHNYWLSNIDPETSLLDWITGEWTLEEIPPTYNLGIPTEEGKQKRRAIAEIQKAGIA